MGKETLGLVGEILDLGAGEPGSEDGGTEKGEEGLRLIKNVSLAT